MDFSYLDDWMEEETGGEVVEEVGEGYRNVWAFAQAAEGQLLPASLETLGQAREMADQIGVYAYGLLLGEAAEALADELIAYGADKVLLVDDPALARYQPETYVAALADLVERYRPEIFLLPATPLGNDLAPRLAQRLDTGLISHCVQVAMDMSERLLLGTFAAMGGEVFHTLTCPQARPQMASLEPGYYPQPYEDSYRSGDVQKVDVDLEGVAGRLSWLEPDVAVDLPPVPLSRAPVIVAAGRGMGDKDGFALVERLARALGGTVAGSRGAYDAGWIDEGQIVGVGGQSVAPHLYLACGLSGDVYHHFGLQDAGFLVAINPDENAPIMKQANLAVVGDAQEIIPAILEILQD